MTRRPVRAKLALDEMFAPAIAAALRQRGHDVVAVAERADLRSMIDSQLFARAVADRRWVLTENVKDFRPILLAAVAAGPVGIGLLCTSSRTFPRSRRNPGPLIEAVHAWLAAGAPPASIVEDWLTRPAPTDAD